MRVLVVHVRYRQRGGEDSVFETESELMRQRGIDVETLALSNDSITANRLSDKVALAINTSWSRNGHKLLAETIRKVNPELVHFHNVFPLLSPSVYYACNKAQIPCVQTLHNYRTVCANAQLIRNQQPCESCLGGDYWHGVQFRCYRNSRAATAAVVTMQYLHKSLGTFAKRVDKFIALTAFAKSKFISGGVPENKIVVKPNCLVDTPTIGNGSGNYAIFVGRLSGEKGVETLLRAWNLGLGIPLKIVGDGPLRMKMESEAMRAGLPVEFLGLVDRDKAIDLIGAARLLVMPSEWYEGFPMTVVEAYSKGTPIIASNIGSLTEIVDDGVTGRKFTPGDANQLALAVNELYYNEQLLQTLRANCRQRFIDRYTGARNIESLLEIYNGVLATSYRASR